MTRRRVAIVGGGFSGAAVAAHLARRGRAAPNITLIERRQRFGPGLAYGTKDPAHLLNVRASNLSVFADEPDHFVRWLQKRGASGQGPASFARRAQYGAYVEEALRKAPSMFGPKITRARGDVVSCAKDGDRWMLSLEGGRSIEADDVVLALGNAPPSAPGFFQNADVPLINPWDANALKTMRQGDVLLLGTGLTAVDVALSMARMRRKGVIYALSRRGQLPRAHLTNPAPPPPHVTPVPVPLSDAVLVLRKEAEAGAARAEPWQYTIDRLRARTPELWQRLRPDAQRRFLRHLRPWWDAHRHRMAPEIAAQIATLQNEGRLRILAGEIVSAEREGVAIHVHHRQRGSKVRHHFEVTGVVNCTGASMDLSSSDNPLLYQLFHDGLVRAPASGIGVEVDAEGRVVSGDGATHANLYALGPITQGVFWESTAIPEIRIRAAAITAMLAPER